MLLLTGSLVLLLINQWYIIFLKFVILPAPESIGSSVYLYSRIKKRVIERNKFRLPLSGTRAAAT